MTKTIRPLRDLAPRLQRSLLVAGCIAVAAALSACGSSPKDDIDPNLSAEKLYEEAREEAADGNYEAAIKLLEKVEGRASGTIVAQQAELDLAYAYYKTNEKAQALAKLDRFIRLRPTSPAIDYAYYLQGLINFNDDLGLFGRLARQDLSERDQQAARDAYESFRQLVERFPESKYAPDARLRMNYIVNSLAQYEVHVARYYYKRGAWLAAANRAQRAVQEFRTSPAIEEALYILVLSYDRLGMKQLRDDAERVLKASFPDSRYLVEGFRAIDKPWWQLW
jgi:outer membrane protein assembly factor BamD